MNGPRVVLVGPTGVGKSTVGRLLAAWWGVAYRDTDDDVVAADGRSIPEIFTADGESAFRVAETCAVRSALAGHRGVLALGGGAVLDAGTRALLAAHPVVCLAMGAEEAARRAGLDRSRPLLAADPGRRWRELMEARRHLYEEVASITVHTDGRTPEEIAQEVSYALESRI
ncbi:shikimate kinase [Streptomyces sp. NPDC017936]|uniref:shikimate kinase n=1 Tax=Streptomyces sp. NPDC017936 TaxID=3365016 RepID=UPI003793349E